MFVTTLVATLPFKRDLRNSVWFWQSWDFTEFFLRSVRCWLPQLVAVKLWKLHPLKDGHLKVFLVFLYYFSFFGSGWFTQSFIGNFKGLMSLDFDTWPPNSKDTKNIFEKQKRPGKLLQIFKLVIQLVFKTVVLVSSQAIGGVCCGYLSKHGGHVVAQHADPTRMVSWVGAREAQIPCENPVFSKFDSEAKQCAGSS